MWLKSSHPKNKECLVLKLHALFLPLPLGTAKGNSPAFFSLILVGLYHIDTPFSPELLVELIPHHLGEGIHFHSIAARESRVQQAQIIRPVGRLASASPGETQPGCRLRTPSTLSLREGLGPLFGEVDRARKERWLSHCGSPRQCLLCQHEEHVNPLLLSQRLCRKRRRGPCR